jgi:hypothetical protein
MSGGLFDISVGSIPTLASKIALGAERFRRNFEATVSKNVSKKADECQHRASPREHSDSTVTLGSSVSLSS